MTHHRVAGLEDLTEQDGALSLGKRFSEWTEAAGVSDVWAVHTLRCACTHTIGILERQLMVKEQSLKA